MKTVGEGDDFFAAWDFAREFQRRLNGIGAGGAGEHGAISEATRFQDQRFERRQKLALSLRVQIETMRDAVRRDVINERLLQQRMIVTVVER